MAWRGSAAQRQGSVRQRSATAKHGTARQRSATAQLGPAQRSKGKVRLCEAGVKCGVAAAMLSHVSRSNGEVLHRRAAHGKGRSRLRGARQWQSKATLGKAKAKLCYVQQRRSPA